MREERRIVSGERWQENVRKREEWKKLLRTARNSRIPHMPMEWMNYFPLLYVVHNIRFFFFSISRMSFLRSVFRSLSRLSLLPFFTRYLKPTMNPYKGAYTPTESSRVKSNPVQSESRVTGCLHRPSRVQSSPVRLLESRGVYIDLVESNPVQSDSRVTGCLHRPSRVQSSPVRL